MDQPRARSHTEHPMTEAHPDTRGDEHRSFERISQASFDALALWACHGRCAKTRYAPRTGPQTMVTMISWRFDLASMNRPTSFSKTDFGAAAGSPTASLQEARHDHSRSCPHHFRCSVLQRTAASRLSPAPGHGSA